MSDSQTTNEQAIAVIGTGRARWQYRGEVYTASGVRIPRDVFRDDDSLITEGIPLPHDADVLEDMTVTLPVEALPVGATLSPVEGVKPKFSTKAHLEAEEVADLKRQNAELRAQVDQLIKDQTTPPQTQPPKNAAVKPAATKAPDPIGDAIGK